MDGAEIGSPAGSRIVSQGPDFDLLLGSDMVEYNKNERCSVIQDIYIC